MANKIFKYSLGFVLLLVQLSYAQAPINKGFLLLENGDFSEAEVFFESFVKTDSLNKTAILCYGRAVGLNGNPQKAKEIFDKLLSDDSKNLEFLINYAEALLWNKEYTIALLKYLELEKSYPNNPIVQLGLANTYSNLKQYKNAINHYNGGIAIDNKILGLYIGLAYTHRANNQDREALEVIEKGLIIDVNNTVLNELKMMIIKTYKIAVNQKTSITNDSGKNTAQNLTTYINVPINTKNSFAVVYQYRNTENKITEDSAIQNTFGLTFKKDLTNQIEFTGNLSYLLSKGMIKYDNIIYKVKLEMKPTFNQSFSVNYQKEYHNFNAQLIDSKIAQNHFFTNYHILTKWNIGWFTQYYFTQQSDNNTRNLWFNSLYYVFKKERVFKLGLNTQIISFKEERPEIYFSPKQFSAFEGFIDVNLSKNKSNYIVNGNLAFGYQYVNRVRQNSFRGELNLGYKISSKFTVNSYGKYSDLSSGTAAGFEFNELGIKINYLF